MKKKEYVEKDIDWINETAENLWKIFNENTDMISESLGIPPELFNPNIPPKVTHLKYDNIRKSIETGDFNNDVSKEQLVKTAINLIKSPKLDTQITFKLLKMREETMSNTISIHDILIKIKEKTEYITGRPLPKSITTTSDISKDTTSESIARFNSVMELVGSLNNDEYDDDEHKGYTIDIIYHTVLLILEHYKSKMNLKTVSRLYNTLCEIYDIIDKISTGGDFSVVLDYVLWITYIAYCLSKGDPNESLGIRFDVDYDTELLTIKVSDIDNVGYMQDIIGRLDDYFMDIHYSIIQDKTYFDKLCNLNTNDFKPKKTIFCIVGESGSGKDTLVEYTLKEFKLNLKPVLSYTDRPMRDGEQNGKEHIFLSKDEMTEFLKSNKKDIAAYTQIGETGYRYCAMTSVIDRSDIYIIDPNGLKEFKERTGDRYNIVSIYIDCPLKERRKRTEGRSDAASKFEARVAAESDQFAKFREEHGYDHVIDNGSMSTIYRSAMTLADIFRYYKNDAR